MKRFLLPVLVAALFAPTAGAQAGNGPLPVTPAMTNFVNGYAQKLVGRSCGADLAGEVADKPVDASIDELDDLISGLLALRKLGGDEKIDYKTAVDRPNNVFTAYVNDPEGDLFWLQQFKGNKMLIVTCTLR